MSATDAAARRRRAVKRGLRFLAIAVAVAACIWALVSQWPQVRAAWSQLSPVNLLGALAAAAVAGVLAMIAWRVLLADAGSPLPLAPASRIYFLSQLGKYVPGSVWVVLGQVELAREQQVPVRRSATISLVHIALGLLSGLLVAAVTLPFVWVDPSTLWWVFLLVPALAIGLHPRVQAFAFGLMFRLLRRPPEPVHTSMRGLLTALVWMVTSWLFYGLHLWLLIRDLTAHGDSARVLLLATGGFAFSWVIGFLVVIAPAGAGIRELILTLVFGSIMTTGAAIIAVLLSRVVVTVVDLLLAGGAVVGAARRRRRTAVPSAEQGVPG